MNGDILMSEEPKVQEPDPWYTNYYYSLDDFIMSMLALGTPLEVSLVGVFDNDGNGRGSRRDVDLPMHQDGIYSAKLADVQHGYYVEKPGIDIVGLYCIKEGTGKCITLVDDAEIELKEKQAVVFDNNRVYHGRKGDVGERLLMRIWIKRRTNNE